MSEWYQDVCQLHHWVFCVSNKNYGAKCSREEPHWENECKFTRTFSTLRDGLSELIGAPLISSDGLLPEQGHVSTFNCCCIDRCSGTDQLDWLFVQIIWQSIQMLYFLYICAQKRLANKSGSRYSLFPADFHPQPPGFESSLQMAVISIVFDMISWYPLMPNCWTENTLFDVFSIFEDW